LIFPRDEPSHLSYSLYTPRHSAKPSRVRAHIDDITVNCHGTARDHTAKLRKVLEGIDS
jgi:LmbE family N-acetylglucosaminyl deacetylase